MMDSVLNIALQGGIGLAMAFLFMWFGGKEGDKHRQHITEINAENREETRVSIAKMEAIEKHCGDRTELIVTQFTTMLNAINEQARVIQADHFAVTREVIKTVDALRVELGKRPG